MTVGILEMGASSIVVTSEAQMDEIIRQAANGITPYRTIMVDMVTINRHPSILKDITFMTTKARQLNLKIWMIVPAGESIPTPLRINSDIIVSQEALLRFGVKNIESYLKNKARMNGGR
jgi:hypothetical protein